MEVSDAVIIYYSAGPSYSMSEQSKFRSFSEDLAKTPGPARYGATDNNKYLRKQPQEDYSQSKLYLYNMCHTEIMLIVQFELDTV